MFSANHCDKRVKTPPHQTRNLRKEESFSYVEEVQRHNGPVQASFPSFYYPVSGTWLEAAVSGIRRSGDSNDSNTRGVIYFPSATDFTIRTRSHARLNHYSHVKSSHPNYHILDSTRSLESFSRARLLVGIEY